MSSTPLQLNQTNQQSLRQLAEQYGQTVDEIVQEAIFLYLHSKKHKQPKSIGLGNSNLGNLSEQVDELLWQE